MNFAETTTPVSMVLLTIGLLFLIGFAADLTGRFTPLPRVTLLLVSGVLIGSSGFDLLPRDFVDTWFPLLTYVSLSIIGFLLGQKVTVAALRERGRVVVFLSIGKVLGAWSLVALTLILLGVDTRLALILAGIAPATAPAATYDVVKEIGAEGSFTDNLLSIVAIDDAWGLLIFSLMIAVAGTIIGEASIAHSLVDGVLEVGGSLLVGVALGVPMAFMTGRIKPGEPTQAEAMGLVLLSAGLALYLDFSPILTAMAMGSTVASFAEHHTRPFHEIEGFEWPFMILFFVLAGASLHINSLQALGWIGIAYVLARCIGIYLGIRLAGRLVEADPFMRKWLGFALLPQAGVALGMALLASQRFPDLAHVILTVVLATTAMLEIVAPFITRRVLVACGDAHRAQR